MLIEPNLRYLLFLDEQNSEKKKTVEGQTKVNATEQPPERSRGKEYLKTSESNNNLSLEIIAIVLSWLLVVITFPFSIYFCYLTVSEYERVVFFRLGRIRKGSYGPGLIWYLPCIDTYELVDLRTLVEEIPKQDMITQDSVTISVGAVVFYYIENSVYATMQVLNVHESALFIAQTTLRNIVGSKTLHDLLTSRESLSKEIEIAVDHVTSKWGLRIERVDIKDINLPEILQRALASEAEALRDARAKIISAEGEYKASQALKEASDVMMENKISLQLRHLQILTSIAQERNVTLIYPFPLDMILPFAEKTGDPGGTPPKDPPSDNFYDVDSWKTDISDILAPIVAIPSNDPNDDRFVIPSNDPSDDRIVTPSNDPNDGQFNKLDDLQPNPIEVPNNPNEGFSNPDDAQLQPPNVVPTGSLEDENDLSKGTQTDGRKKK